ncbi:MULTISPECIES: DUF3237 domain-containing protein [unclassified Mycobacterium]|uniref:DUF3237 domain-containing protein n=1 Tax=unclassified Mycobacterium TaxID=2642494 RepID=UPI0029C914EC|nr:MULTISPECIES: DUF3237 domain-containing protein [unclassified Mycobacterium]
MSSTDAAVGVGLELEFEFNAKVKAPVAIGPGPHGMRMFFETVEGELVGERVSGRVLTGGGDWFLVGPDGWGRLDARAQFETSDGAVIYASYTGHVEMNEAVAAAVGTGGGTQFEDQYMRAAVALETGDPRYAWVNHNVFIYEGRFAPDSGVNARIYRVT